MKKKGMEIEMTKYMKDCKEFYNDPDKYSFYIHGYFISHIAQLQKQGKLKKPNSSVWNKIKTIG